MPISEPAPDNPPAPADAELQGSSRAPARLPQQPAEALVDVYHDCDPSLRRYLTARLRSRQEAEEVIQETFEQVLGQRQHNTINFLRHYVWKIAANRATDRLRQRSNRQRLTERQVFETEETRSPERAVAGEQELELLRAALEHLDEQTRTAFLLVKFQGLTSVDAARVIGITPQTVRKYVANALAYCYDVLNGKGTSQGGST